MPVLPQDLADACNTAGVTTADLPGMLASLLVITPGLQASKLTAPQFGAVMGGAVALTAINQIKAQIAQAQAAQQTADNTSATAIQTLNSQLATAQAAYNAQFGDHS